MKIKGFWDTAPAVDENCSECGLYKNCKDPFPKVHGEGKMNVMLVTGKPSDSGPFSGETMNVLKEYFSAVGVNIERNFYKTSAVACYHKEEVEDNQITRCREGLRESIRTTKPKHIIAVGAAATKSLVGDMIRKMLPVETMCFHKIPVYEYNAWVYPILDPTKFNTENQKSYFKRLVKYVLAEIKKKEEILKVDPFEHVKIFTKPAEIIDVLDDLLQERDFISAFDIESTGLKPHWKEHEITTMAIATRKGSIAFPISHNEFKCPDKFWVIIEELIQEYLIREDVKKIAHPLKFDTMWCETIFGVKVNGWLQCTQTNQHLLDPRVGGKGLKELGFLLWGIHDYEHGTEGFIAPDEPGAKALNRMREMPLIKQLLYVGADAYLTLKLSDAEDDQYLKLDSDKKAFPRLLFLESSRTLCTMQNNGIPVDSEYYLNADKEVTEKINEIEQRIANNQDVRKFRNLFRKEFEHSKAKDLKDLLFKVMKLDPKKVGKTDSGNISLDEKALKEFGEPICEDILSLRKLMKVRDTYISQFIKEDVGGRIHPFFDLTKVRSFRSSSSSPKMVGRIKLGEFRETHCGQS